MKIKLTALLLCISIAISLLVAIPVSAEDDGIVKEGLVAWYDGVNNTGSGHNASATTWKDLAGNNDITLTTDANTHFTDDAFLLNSKKNKFPSAIKNVINSAEFTVELTLGDVTPIGASFATLLNNLKEDGTASNDNFALFYRVEGNYIEFKFQSAKDGRPKASNGLNYLKNSTIAITFKAGGNVCMYSNGILIGQGKATATINADGELYFGHDASAKAHKTEYRSMKFYNRELTAAEIRKNAGITDNKITTNGLIAWYDGLNNTGNGHSASATIWKDLAGNNDITLTTDANNRFIDDAFLLNSKKNKFPSAVKNVINSAEFTVELTLGDVTPIGASFATFINNIKDGETASNDNFSLFYRVEGDYIEFKFQKSAEGRPKVAGGLDYFKNSTITITFVAGGNVNMYVDGVLIAQATSTGTIGADGDLCFGHDGSTKLHKTEYRSMRFYNRELNASEILNNARADKTAEREFTSVKQPKTNIVGDICVSSYITSQADLDKAFASSAKPANLIFYTNEKLEITANDFTTAFSTVDSIADNVTSSFIPTFCVKNSTAAEAVANHLKKIKLIDAYIMSSDPAAVKSARNAYPYIRGIIDFSSKYTSGSITKEQLIDIRKTTISNLCHVAVIPQEIATQENVKYLNDRQITTWASESDATSTEAGTTSMLLSGAYGVIVKDYELLFSSASKHINPNTITRPPLIVGHRGIPSTMPENTLEGAIEAYNQGADVIEIDLYISSDGVVVINHDAKTSDYNENISVEASTYAKLKTLTYSHGGKTYRMPSLEDFLKEFQGKDIILFLEIKSTKSNIVSAIKTLVNKYNMYDQCAVIAFEKTGQLARLKSTYPEMPVGFLSSQANTGLDLFPSIQKTVMTHNTTYNPTHSGYDANYVRYSVMRGITTWPWTINTESTIMSFINHGHSGITTNYCNVTKNMVNNLKITLDKLTDYQPDSTIDLTATKTTYARATTDASVNYILLDGSDTATLNNGKLTFNGEGSVTLAAVYTETYKGMNYSIYSQPITVSTVEAIKPENTPPENNVPENDVPENNNSENNNSDNSDLSDPDGSTPPPEGETNLIGPNETETATDKLTPVKKKGGCGSTVATATAIIGLVSTLGAALLIKKKD